MNLRIATWNMRGEGVLTPAKLVDLILDPVNAGGAAGASGSKRKSAPVAPIDLIALQEFPLATGAGSFHQRLAAELASRLQTATYAVSPVFSSITQLNQTAADVEYEEQGRRDASGARATVRRTVRITLTDTGKSDAYAFVYDTTKISGFTFPEHSPRADNPHRTSRYTIPFAGRDVPRGGLNKLLADSKKPGQAAFSDSLTKAFFLHRPLYARCKADRVTMHIYSWHAPEEGVMQAGSQQTRFYAYEAIRLFKAFNFSSIPGGLGAAEAAADLILVMGDFNAAKADVSIIPAAGLREHMAQGLDHILLGGATGVALTRVPNIYDVVRTGESDHALVVADLAGAPVRVPAGSPASGVTAVASPSSAASTSAASTSTSTASTASTATTSTASAPTGPATKKARTGAAPTVARPKRRARTARRKR